MAYVIRRDAGLYGYERALGRAGFAAVAGADEAGRGACAGPLVAAACVLGGRLIPGLDDSKKLTPAARARLYDLIVARAVAWAVVRIEPAECDDEENQSESDAAHRADPEGFVRWQRGGDSGRLVGRAPHQRRQQPFPGDPGGEQRRHEAEPDGLIRP